MYNLIRSYLAKRAPQGPLPLGRRIGLHAFMISFLCLAHIVPYGIIAVPVVALILSGLLTFTFVQLCNFSDNNDKVAIQDLVIVTLYWNPKLMRWTLERIAVDLIALILLLHFADPIVIMTMIAAYLLYVANEIMLSALTYRVINDLPIEFKPTKE